MQQVMLAPVSVMQSGRAEQLQFRFGESFRVPGLSITTIHFNAPLDHSNPEGEHIEIFARVASHPNHISESKLPFLLYMQGAPYTPFATSQYSSIVAV